MAMPAGWAGAPLALALLLGACSADGPAPQPATESAAATSAGDAPTASPTANSSPRASSDAPADADPAVTAGKPESDSTGDTPPGTAMSTPGDSDPAAEPGPVPDAPRTADGEPAGPAASGIISSCALGPLVVGMNAERAEATGLAEWLLASDGPSGFIFKPSPDVFIAGTEADGIVGFLVKSDDWRTPEGIAVGLSGRDDLQQAYGDDLQERTTPEGYPYFLLRDGDCGYFFAPDSFGPDDGPIIVIISGRWDAVSQARPNTSFG
jgi:hypothetical protein